MKKLVSKLLIFSCLSVFSSCAQSSSGNWPSPKNITSILDSSGVIELSGLHYNPMKNTLYAVQDNGGLYLLKHDVKSNNFVQLGNTIHLGGPEGICQVDYALDEFYTIDEKNYEIRRFSHNADLSKVTLMHKWSLLLEASHMINTDNDGPEGIEFIPDSYLKAAKFISTETNDKYCSKKGMGGLIFIAHQKKGLIWVYDVNPNQDDDYEFVGKYKTSKHESCDLSFDRSTGLLYILHNTDGNSLEVTDLSIRGKREGKQKFFTVGEFTLPKPSGSQNIEGVAVIPKFATPNCSGILLCRDISVDEKVAEAQNCIWWFTPFTLQGNLVKNWNRLSKR